VYEERAVSTRERLSEKLLRIGTKLAVERIEMSRRIAADPRRPDYDRALAVLVVAEWVDSTILWLSWRLRPRRALGAGLD
jgi:hypothetical protein